MRRFLLFPGNAKLNNPATKFEIGISSGGSKKQKEPLMPIFKADIANQFTQIPNKTLRDTALSFEAKGVLCLILSLPSDWEIHKAWLQKQAVKCGQDKLKRILKELEEAGYMCRKARQGDGGKMAGWDWFVYPTKQLEASNIKGLTDGVKIRPSVKPSDGRTPTTNKDVYKERKSSELVNTPEQKKFENASAEQQKSNQNEFFEQVVEELNQDGLNTLSWEKQRYAQMKIREFISRFPQSYSIGDCWSYVLQALDHRFDLTGR